MLILTVGCHLGEIALMLAVSWCHHGVCDVHVHTCRHPIHTYIGGNQKK